MTDDQEMREYARALFTGDGRPRRTPTEPEVKPPGGHVAREGVTHQPAPKDPVRDFVYDLFGVDENARHLHRD